MKGYNVEVKCNNESFFYKNRNENNQASNLILSFTDNGIKLSIGKINFGILIIV